MTGVSAVAAVVHRLAVLLSAGVAPASAWGYLGADGLPAGVAVAAAGGAAIPDAILAECASLADDESEAWHGLAVAWAVAVDAGAPLAPTLREFAGTLRSLGETQREISVALAAPVATARLVMVLPVVGVFFGMALGFNTLQTLLATPAGFACLTAGVSLLVLASRWNRSMVRAAQPKDLTPGLLFDLTAIAVSGGSSIERARAAVDRALATFAPTVDGDTRAVDDVLDLSRRAGVPAVELLRSEAEESRLNARAETREQCARLSVRLMLPLGLCVLPAFMVLGVIPLMITVVTSTVTSF